MKLLNREPTHVQLDAMSAYSDDLSKYRAAMDAAPDVKVDMEPVAQMQFLAFGKAIMPLGNKCDGEDVGAKFYSTKSVAALQAENERLQKANGVLNALCEDRFNEVAKLHSDLELLTAERDELQAKVDSLMLEYCPDEMSAEQLKTWGEHQVITKHEGEKHDAP